MGDFATGNHSNRQNSSTIKPGMNRMSDRIPDVSMEDVSRIIRRDFSDYDSKIILEILDAYSDGSAAARVHLDARLRMISRKGVYDCIFEYTVLAVQVAAVTVDGRRMYAVDHTAPALPFDLGNLFLLDLIYQHAVNRLTWPISISLRTTRVHPTNPPPIKTSCRFKPDIVS